MTQILQIEIDGSTLFSHVLGVSATELGRAGLAFRHIGKSDNDNPALANFLKLLGERYPLPVDRA